MASGNWNIDASIVSKRTSNPIRKVVDQLNEKPKDGLTPIALSIGDPTVFGNLPPPNIALETAAAMATEGKSNGYFHSCGAVKTREAVARYHSSTETYTADDVVLASGCSGALDLSIGVLANEGDNMLLPNPGFSLYRTLCDSKGIECRFYNLLPNKNWEIDLADLESKVDSRTKAILINNPSNPCGSVFTREHTEAIVALASRLRLPIIADEMYAYMTFSGVPFTSILDIAGDKVPVLVTCGLAKRFMVPGWRIGWIIIHDKAGAFAEIRKGLLALSTLILGPNSIAQASVPKILQDTPKEYYATTIATLEHNAKICMDKIKQIPGLTAIEPKGAMYLMVGINVDQFDDTITNDVQFCRKLISEQAITVLPGSCFGYANYFRIVVCPPPDKLAEALDRIGQFCKSHYTSV